MIGKTGGEDMAVDLDVMPSSKTSQSTPPNKCCAGALVMDADYRGLAVVRSLGRHGIPVWVLKHGDQLLATMSRYNRRTLSWPSQDQEQKVNFLVNLADREDIRNWVLFPTGDEGAALVARHHQTLGKYYQLTTIRGRCTPRTATRWRPANVPTRSFLNLLIAAASIDSLHRKHGALIPESNSSRGTTRRRRSLTQVV